MPTIKIVSRYDGAKVLFECEVTDEQKASGIGIRVAMERATQAGADLRGAYLTGANLGGADLIGAYLTGAYLAGANLGGAYLTGAYLAGANLGGADLTGAYLTGADLTGAYLGGADLTGAYLTGRTPVGTRPILQIGPIGSRSDYLQAFLTNDGVMVRAGCFFGTLDEFRFAVEKTHGDSNHGREYEAAMLMIEAHAVIWTPKEVAQ